MLSVNWVAFFFEGVLLHLVAAISIVFFDVKTVLKVFVAMGVCCIFFLFYLKSMGYVQ